MLRAKNVSGADSAETVCGTCPHLEGCRAGGIYGFLHDRAESLQSTRLRAHPQSLPATAEYDFENIILVWDEVSQILKATEAIEVTSQDLTQVIAELAVKCPEQFEILRPLLSELRQYLSGEVRCPKFGWNHNRIVEILPSVPEFNPEAIDQALKPDLGFLNSTEEYGVDLEDLPPHLRKRFTNRDSDLAEQATKEVTKQWLLEFLGILNGGRGYLHIKHGMLTITLPDKRLAAIASSAKANLFLDATLSPEELAQTLGCDPSEIFHIQQETPDNDNLEVIQVTGMKRLGMGRGNDQQRRAESVIQQLTHQYPDAKVVDFKRFTEEGDGKGKWWVDSRGSNDFEKTTTLILTGTPCRNLADLEAEFTCLYGRVPVEGKETVRYQIEVNNPLPDDVAPYFETEDSVDPEFREFVRRKILADIKQGIGRLRAHRRPGEKLKIYFLGDYALDVPVTLADAATITPEAGTKIQRVEAAIRQAVTTLRARGIVKITQQAIADLVGVSQGYISRFRELLLLLLDTPNSKSNNSVGPPPDVGEFNQQMADVVTQVVTEAPEKALEGIGEVFLEWLPRRQWHQVWQLLTADVQVRLLQHLFVTLPAGELHQLYQAIGGSP